MSNVAEGIVVGGVVLPGTEWVLRDPHAWFAPDYADAPPRKYWPITQMVFHWTGGMPHTSADAAQTVVRNMKARLRVDGTEMSVSCHFVVSWDGVVFQVCDLARMAIHAGRVLNRDGIGIEQCWPGTERQMMKLRANGYVQRRFADGNELDCMRPSEAMINASCRLAEALVVAPASARIQIPRVVPASTKRMRSRAAASFRGACEHVHSPGSKKLDCAGYVIDALAARGWARS